MARKHDCISPTHLVSGGIVVLFSNDTQLCSKAIVNGIKAFNSKVCNDVIMMSFQHHYE